MKSNVIILAILVFILIILMVAQSVLTNIMERNDKEEKDHLRRDLRRTQINLKQCSECCNEMNKSMVRFHVRKDSILVDHYERMGL